MTTLAIFAGQSNAGGYGMSPSTLPSTLATANYGQTYVWGGSYGTPWFGVYQPGVNSGNSNLPTMWGPEAQFAYDFRQANPTETLIIVKVTQGSTTLASNASAMDWSPSTHELFDLTTSNIQAARSALAANGVTVDHEVVLWMQGESDAGSAATAAAYGANLTDFLAHVRTDWLHDADGKVAVGRIADSPMAYDGVVRTAQRAVDQADPDTLSFNTIGFPMQADGLHYAAGGHVALGASFFDAFDVWF